jgi:hypothetical protein
VSGRVKISRSDDAQGGLMHRLTNNDADRLAADLDRAAAQLHHYAALEQRYADGLRQLGDFTRAEYHARNSETRRPRQDRARPTAAFPAPASAKRRTRRRAA